jgi:transposase
MARPAKFSPEVKERTVRLVLEHQSWYGSQYEAIRSVAGKIGCTPEPLRGWVRQAERDSSQRPGLTTDEQAQVAALERDNRELRRANEILETKKAAAFFAQAELDRRALRVQQHDAALDQARGVGEGGHGSFSFRTGRPDHDPHRSPFPFPAERSQALSEPA